MSELKIILTRVASFTVYGSNGWTNLADKKIAMRAYLERGSPSTIITGVTALTLLVSMELSEEGCWVSLDEFMFEQRSRVCVLKRVGVVLR